MRLDPLRVVLIIFTFKHQIYAVHILHALDINWKVQVLVILGILTIYGLEVKNKQLLTYNKLTACLSKGCVTLLNDKPVY